MFIYKMFGFHVQEEVSLVYNCFLVFYKSCTLLYRKKQLY